MHEFICREMSNLGRSLHTINTLNLTLTPQHFKIFCWCNVSVLQSKLHYVLIILLKLHLTNKKGIIMLLYVFVRHDSLQTQRNSTTLISLQDVFNLPLQKRWLQAVLLVKGNRHSPSQYRHPRSVLHRRLEVSDKVKTLFTLMLHTGTAAQRQKCRNIL